MQREVPEQVRRENWHVLNLVSALVGTISPNMRSISIEALGDYAVRLHFLLESDDPADAEEIADVASEFEVLYDRPIEVEVNITSSTAPEAVMLPGRRVYGRREG